MIAEVRRWVIKMKLSCLGGNGTFRALVRLYRRQFLQLKTRWKALDEIYKIYTFLHRSELKVAKNIASNVYKMLAIVVDFAKNVAQMS